jgi:cupin fold WbuC family metalloprotein
MKNVLHAAGDIEVVDWTALAELKRIAFAHPMRRSRLCLHHDAAALTQEMIIVAHRSTYIRPHRHPSHKSESYHIIEGEMDVRLFGDEGELQRVVRLSVTRRESFLFRVSNGAWHQPVPVSEWIVYHEAYSGPFEKSVDVEYAPWAPAERAV